MFLVFMFVQVLMIHFYCVFSKGISILLYIIYEDINYIWAPRRYLQVQTVFLKNKLEL
jgi:hypothetical protein